MKTILMLAHDDSGQEARFQAALDVTRAVEGHLTCLDATPFVPFAGDGYGLADAGVALLQAEREVEGANRARLEARLKVEDVAWDWIEVIADYDAALADAAGLADLIVVNHEIKTIGERDVRMVSEDLLARSGKPLLAVGGNPSGFPVADPVLIAWDGSDQAAAAVKAAVPLLQLSDSVTIFEIDDGSTDAPAETAAAYLSRHGIHAEVVRQKVPDKDFVEPMLLAKLSSGRFGWAVMGAFSRPRLAEMLFGGTTRRMLAESPVPLLIAH